MLHRRDIDAISESDLDDLVRDQVAELRELDYKRDLPGGKDSDKKEFLADVTSFANSAGGALVYGIDAPNGLPLSMPGIQTNDPDADLLRLESLVRTGVQPRLVGMRMRSLLLANGGYVFLILAPRSWLSPHAVTVAGSFRFFARNSAGKYPLDVVELRAAFEVTGRAIEWARTLRRERLGLIAGRATPVRLCEGPIIVLHMIPLAAADGLNRIESDLDDIGLLPLYGGAWSVRRNFDGALAVTDVNDDGTSSGYTQLFRSGLIEGVDALMLRGGETIPSTTFEERLLERVGRYLRLQDTLGVQPPVLVMLTLLGVEGMTMGVDRSRYFSTDEHVIDRDELVVPEEVVERLDSPASAVLRPALDAVWNASGWAKSPNFDDAGNWKAT